jgi:chromosome segregation ATPase
MDIDPNMLALASAVGLPGLVGAIGYGVRSWGDARVKVATARETAAKADAEAAKTASGAYTDARADLEECKERGAALESRLSAAEGQIDTLAGSVRTVERAHEECTRRCEALGREMMQLRDSIGGDAR